MKKFILILIFSFTFSSQSVLGNVFLPMQLHKEVTVNEGDFEVGFYLQDSNNVVIIVPNIKGLDSKNVELIYPNGKLVNIQNAKNQNIDFEFYTPKSSYGLIVALVDSWLIRVKDAPAGKYYLRGESTSEKLPISIINNDSSITNFFTVGQFNLTPQVNTVIPLVLNLFEDLVHFPNAKVSFRVSKDGKELYFFTSGNVDPYLQVYKNQDIYFSAFKPEEPGEYKVVIKYSGTDKTKQKFEGESVENFIIYKTLPTISDNYSQETLDLNNNGYMDELILTFPISGKHPLTGKYSVYGRIKLGENTYLLDRRTIDVSEQKIYIKFDGKELRRAGYSGAIDIEAVSIEHNDIVINYFENLESTIPYDKDIWERDVLELANNFTDMPVDIDGDGYYDGIEISYDVDSLVVDNFKTLFRVYRHPRKRERVGFYFDDSYKINKGLNKIKLTIPSSDFIALESDAELVIDYANISHQSVKKYDLTTEKKWKTRKYICEQFAGCKNSAASAIKDKQESQSIELDSDISLRD